MKARLGIAAIGAALAMAGVATGAHAAAAKPNDSTAAASAASAFGDTGNNNAVNPNAPHKSLRWDSKGRWGLKLDYQQPGARDAQQFQSIDVGGFYKVTPRLHIGGAIGVGEQPDPRLASPEPQAPQPRVRLETTFKF
jgi:NtrZ